MLVRGSVDGLREGDDCPWPFGGSRLRIASRAMASETRCLMEAGAGVGVAWDRSVVKNLRSRATASRHERQRER
ncbi:MAG: hypothetical protein A2638_06645 [Nitrospirae bacterium RIFCSPHIGHO2_01_FULL_66_17]|nr:MAG: hypothetical protein A2638_06645 [Nitrospirae bacterium RIFCSPHIGHO2_01_FULL_66_17]